MLSRIFHLAATVFARKLVVRKAACEVLEQRQLLAARAFGELGGGFRTELLTAGHSPAYTFSVSGAVRVDTWLGTGTATILNEDGKPVASGRRKLSHVLGTGTYTLQTQTPPNTVLTIGTKRMPALAPTRLEASVWGGKTIRLNWDDNADTEVQYRVDRWTKAGWRRSIRVGQNATAAVIDNLPLGSRTTYRVSAVSKNGGSVRSMNTVIAQTSTEDTSGWYRINMSRANTGSASWSMHADNLKVQAPNKISDNESKWVFANSWQAAVNTVISTLSPSPVQIKVTNDSGGRANGDIVDHAFPAGGDFKVATVGDLRSQGGTGANRFKITGLANETKLIALEDSYGSIDRDYDDFYWTVDAEFVRLTQATFIDANNSSVGSVTATDTETDPLWVEGWHSGGAKVSVTTDLNDASAAEHFLVRLTDVISGSEQTLTLAEVQSSGIAFGQTILYAEIGFDADMDGVLDDSGETAFSAATSSPFTNPGGNVAAATDGGEDAYLGIGLIFGPIGVGVAVWQAGIGPHDLYLLGQYTRGRTAIYNLTGAQHNAYFGDNDVVAAIANFDQQFGQHVDQKGTVLTQANAQTTFDFTPQYTHFAGEDVQIQDSIFSMGNGRFQSRYTGTITAIQFAANGNATKWRVSGTAHRFTRDVFEKPAGNAVGDIRPGFEIHADRSDTVQEDRP